MKAIQFIGNNKVQLVDRPMPRAAGTTVVVKVTASGICGTDVDMLLSSSKPLETIGGHEGAGIVVEVDKAARFKVGDRVIINCHITCGTCGHCMSGDLIFCPSLQAYGFDRDGANTEYMAVEEGSLRYLPDDISDEIGVLLTDALSTPYSAIKRASIESHEAIGIFGVGPLGQMAVLCASDKTQSIVAVDISDERLDRARRFGAALLLNPRRCDVLAEINTYTDGKGLDKTLDCSGNSDSINMALDSLCLRGMHVQVGVCRELRLNTMSQIINKELMIQGSRNMNDHDLPVLIELARHKPQVCDIITHRFRLKQAQEAFDCARSKAGIKMLFKP